MTIARLKDPYTGKQTDYFITPDYFETGARLQRAWDSKGWEYHIEPAHAWNNRRVGAYWLLRSV
jgi:hypothetical protein